MQQALLKKVDLANFKKVVKKDRYDESVKKVNDIQTTDTSNLVKEFLKLDRKYFNRNHYQYITRQKFKKLTSENFAARLKQANTAIKPYIDGLEEKTDFDDKLKKLIKK